jgi:hypothetical protein
MLQRKKQKWWIDGILARWDKRIVGSGFNLLKEGLGYEKGLWDSASILSRVDSSGSD